MESSTENYYQLVVILTVVSAVLLVVIVVIVYCWRYKQFCRRTGQRGNSVYTSSSAIAERPRALRIIEYFAKSLKFTQGHPK